MQGRDRIRLKSQFVLCEVGCRRAEGEIHFRKWAADKVFGREFGGFRCVWLFRERGENSCQIIEVCKFLLRVGQTTKEVENFQALRRAAAIPKPVYKCAGMIVGRIAGYGESSRGRK